MSLTLYVTRGYENKPQIRKKPNKPNYVKPKAGESPTAEFLKKILQKTTGEVEFYQEP